MTEKERLNLASWAIEYAKKSGADQAAVAVSRQREIDVEYRDKKLDKLQESVKNSLSIKLYVANRYSAHSTNYMSKNSLKGWIDEAVAATKYLAKDEFRSLPDPQYYPKDTDIDLKIYDPQYHSIETSKRKAIAAEIEAIAMAQSDKIISVTAGYFDSHAELVRVHSNGFTGQTKGTSFQIWVVISVKDADGKKPRDWCATETRFYSELSNSEFIAKEAVRRALRKLGQDKIESGRYNMIVENRAGYKPLSTITAAMVGVALYRKKSYLDGLLGKKVASEKLTMIDKPFIEKGLGSRLFDSEGLAAKKRVMIEKGVLRYYYIDDYYGKKLSMAPTSGGQSNTLFEYGSKSLDELTKTMKDGILVTDFLGGNCNSTTGDFSFGIAGQLIKNGEIDRPVSSMTISGNAKELWNQLVEVGCDAYLYSGLRSPSMLFENISFSGT